MSEESCTAKRPSRGFTLIEVIGALVIFSLGVLMVLQLSDALGDQMEYAATASEIAVKVQERLDSLEAEPFSSLSAGTGEDTMMVNGTSYTLTATISTVTALLYQIDVDMSPASGYSGPTYSATSYSADSW